MDKPTKRPWWRRTYRAAREFEWNWSLLQYLGVGGSVTSVVSGGLTAVIAAVQGWAAAPAIAVGAFVAACATVVVAGARAHRQGAHSADRLGAAMRDPDVEIAELRVELERLRAWKEHRSGWDDEMERYANLKSEHAGCASRIAALRAEAEGANTSRSELEDRIKSGEQDLADEVNRREGWQQTAIQMQRSIDQGLARIAELEPYAPPPPPTSDLDDAERAVAFSELAKILKKLEETYEPTLTMLDRAADDMRPRHGDIAKDLTEIMAERFREAGEPVRNAARSCIEGRTSAETGQDLVASYVGHYDRLRRWLVRSAGHGGAGPEWLDGYSDWHKKDVAIWSFLDDQVTKTGPLRRLHESLRNWRTVTNSPADVPEPLSDRLRGTDNSRTDDERG